VVVDEANGLYQGVDKWPNGPWVGHKLAHFFGIESRDFPGNKSAEDLVIALAPSKETCAEIQPRVSTLVARKG